MKVAYLGKANRYPATKRFWRLDGLQKKILLSETEALTWPGCISTHMTSIAAQYISRLALELKRTRIV